MSMQPYNSWKVTTGIVIAALALVVSPAAWAQSPPAQYAISGTVGGAPAGLSVQIKVLKPTGQLAGQFAVLGTGTWSGRLTAGEYVVQPFVASGVFTPATRSINLDRNLTGLDFHFVPQTGTISGRITGSCPASPPTTLHYTWSTLVQTSTVNSSNAFTSAALPRAVWRVTPSLNSSFEFLPAYRDVDITKHDVNNVEFVCRTIGGTAARRIAGRVNGLQAGTEARMMLSGDRSYTTTTARDGSWAIDNVAAGVYTMTPSNSNYSFSPPSQRVDLTLQNNLSVNFTALPKVVTP